MISKELLSEVLKQDVYELSVVFNVIEYKSTQFKYISSDTINIYELAHKCKVWAYKNKYYLNSDLTSCEVWKDNKEVYNSSIDLNFTENVLDNIIREPESIFKACQWILDSKED